MAYMREPLISGAYQTSGGREIELYGYSGDLRFDAILAGSTRENLEKKIFAQAAPDFDLIIDAGANYGEFLWEMNPEKPAYAFEPNPRICNAVRKTAEENGYRRIILRRKALSSTPGGTVSFHESTLSSGASSLSKSRSGSVARDYGKSGLLFNTVRVKVPLTSIDAEVGDQAVNQSVLLKIDCEGYDVAVLLGARNTLAAASNYLVILELARDIVAQPDPEFISLVQKAKFLYAIYENRVHALDSGEMALADLRRNFERAPGQIDLVLASEELTL